MRTEKPKKTVRKSFRLTESCAQQLKQLAESTFRSETNVIEMLIAQTNEFSLKFVRMSESPKLSETDMWRNDE